MPVTPSTLAEAANRRKLSMIPEKAWEARTKINPVEHAVRYERALQERRFARKTLGGAAGTLLIALPILFGLTLAQYNQSSTAAWQFTAAIGATVGVTFVFICCVGAFLDINVDGTYEKAQVELFCSDMTALRTWLYRVSIELLGLGDPELREGALLIMKEVTVAIGWVSHQELWPNQDSMVTQRLKLALQAELHLRYDTLQRLGLVSGGFGKYFDTTDLKPGRPNELLNETRAAIQAKYPEAEKSQGENLDIKV